MLARPGEALLSGVLVLAMGVGPLTTYAVTALSPSITEQLGVSRTGLGALATTVFAVAAFCSLIGARATVAFGSRAVLLTLFGIAALAVTIVATSRSYDGLLVGVGLSGLAQSMSNPATNEVVSTRTQPERRGTIIGLKQSGVQMSQALAGLSLPALALLVGWRGAVAATGVIVASGLALSVLVLPRRPRRIGRARARNVALRSLPGAVWWLGGYTALMAAALQATNVYLPLFAYQRLHLGSATAGLTVAVVGMVGVGARIVWGRLSAAWADPKGLMLITAGGSALSVVLILCAEVTHETWLVWPGAALDGATALASSVVVTVCVVRWLRGAALSTATGVLAICMYTGFALGPLGFGLLVDYTHDYVVGFWLLVGLFAGAGLLTLRWNGYKTPPLGALAHEAELAGEQ